MKNALITNILSHYREPIYSKMIENGFDIYGDTENPLGIKPIEIDKKVGYFRVKNKYFKNIVFWQNDVIRLVFKRYDSFILLADVFSISSWFFLIVSRLKNKKVFLWGHGFLGKESFFKRKLRLTFFNLADGIFVYGHRGERILKEQGYKKHISVIYNSLNYNYQNSLLKSTDKKKLQEIKNQLFDDNNEILLYSGRITIEKKLDQLIDAAYILREKYNKAVNVLFIGAGGDIERLREYSKLKGVNCNFYGACYDERDLSYLFQLSTLCVAPSHIGLTGIHSFTYGLPVITHNDFDTQMPEFEVIEDGVNGYFFKKNNIDDLASKINLYLDKSYVERNDFIENCFHIIESRYNADVQMEIIKRVL